MATNPKGYLATDAQVATLAKEYVTNATGAENARGTYLRILLAHSLRELHKSPHKRHTSAEALGAIESAHAHLYAVVVEATLTPDVAPEPKLSDEERRRRTQERNRRTNFARSSKSEIAAFIKAGGRLASLSPETITRDALRQFSRAAREGPKSLPDRITAAVERLTGLTEQLLEEPKTAAKAAPKIVSAIGSALAEFIQQWNEQDADAAREAVTDLEADLTAIVAPPKRMTGRRKVGGLTLHAEQ